MSASTKNFKLSREDEKLKNELLARKYTLVRQIQYLQRQADACDRMIESLPSVNKK